MQRVFVLSADGQALDPCHPARARSLLRERRAAIARRYPFTIILKERMAVESVAHAHAVKIDPGSKTTGMAVVNDSGLVVWAAEIEHRGQQIRDRLLARRQQRHSRRSRKTRYRPARFDNRRRAEGWLPPSLMSRVANIATWVSRLQRVAPVAWLSLELVKFDTQALVDPEISGAEYQQGTLYGYEVREYLLEKWGRKCAYCGAKMCRSRSSILFPGVRGGTNRVDNLTLGLRAVQPEKREPRPPPSLVIPTCTRKPVNRCGMLPLLTQLAGRSISVCARQACPLNAVQADEQNSIVSPLACPKSIGWMRPVWASRAQTYKSLRPSPRLSFVPRGTVRARCAAWTDTVSRARGRKERAGFMVSGQGIWCAPLCRAAKGPERIPDGSPCALPGVSMFPLPAEHCRELAGDIASFFTVPMAMLIHLNRKEAAFPPHC